MSFRNEAWSVGEAREIYLRTLRAIRFHESLPRIGLPTTTLLFVSRLSDPPIRQYFEDSSRHFKTYNLYTDTTEFFTDTDSRTRTPMFVLDWLDFFYRINILGIIIRKCLTVAQRSHLNYRASLRSLTLDQLATQLTTMYQTIGLTSFAKLNVIIASKENKDVVFGVRFLCECLEDESLKSLLSKRDLQVPTGYQTMFGVYDPEKSSLKYFVIRPIHALNSSLFNYLERKTASVMEKLRVREFVGPKAASGKRTLILGRRVLTRGHDVLNESSLIQSYDYELDVDQKRLHLLLKSALGSFRRADLKALIIIESFPAQVSDLISKDMELQKLLNGEEIALACVEPETKAIYALKGKEFVSKDVI